MLSCKSTAKSMPIVYDIFNMKHILMNQHNIWSASDLSSLPTTSTLYMENVKSLANFIYRIKITFALSPTHAQQFH